MKKQEFLEISSKSTKEQILSAYNEVLAKFNEKQIITPQEQRQQEEKNAIVVKASNNSADTILTDLGVLKSKTIKQIDNLSEQLLDEFQKLATLREAITLEQKHLQELYQIKETVHTLSVLLQTQAEQKEQFKLEMDKTKQAFEQEMITQKSIWQQQREQLEKDYNEEKEKLEKMRKHEEEDYAYTLELNRRKEMDEYNNKKVIIEKEISNLQTSLLKRETDLVEKEEIYQSLKVQVEQFPVIIEEKVKNAEEKLHLQMSQQYDFESQLKQKEYDGILTLKEQNIKYLEEKIKHLEGLIKDLRDKADIATQQVQSIACRALDTSAQRFTTLTNNEKEKNSV